MNLGALIDLGVPFDYLQRELSKLKVQGYTLEHRHTMKMGINGTSVTVTLENNAPNNNEHSLHKKHIYHEQRNFESIKKIITYSSLSDYVKRKSIEAFLHIAKAEAKIHAKSISNIHFHEVGAIDSIVDIVGAALCIEYLHPEKIIGSSVELGSGFVDCAHGRFPVPAPATTEILKGIPVKRGNADKEATTPTGAAILKIFVDTFSDRIDFRIQNTAYGIGQYSFPIPNVLRIYQGEMQTSIMSQ